MLRALRSCFFRIFSSTVTAPGNEHRNGSSFASSKSRNDNEEDDGIGNGTEWKQWMATNGDSNENRTEGVVGLIRWSEKMETVLLFAHSATVRRDIKLKLMTKVYCPRNEIQKMETELWNLSVKNNDMATYTQRFQELTMMCTKMVPEEEDRVEKFIGGLPDNIQRNVIAAEPTRLQDAIRISNNLMDQKLKGYAVRNAENKRRLKNNYRTNRGQQPPHKR
ncbi:reverse transcriptase domain-containing protein [Tanacetum coccineum]